MSDEKEPDEEAKKTFAKLEGLADKWMEEKNIYRVLCLDAPGYVRWAILAAFVQGYLIGGKEASEQTDEVVKLAQKVAALAETSQEERAKQRLLMGL